MAGTIAAAVHMFTIIGSLRSTNPDTALACLFIPSPGKVDHVSRQPMNATFNSTILPPKYQVLLEGYHLFTQFDWIVVAISAVVFTYYLLSNSARGTTESALQQIKTVESRALVYLALGTIVFGPGAAGSFALAVRESSLREQDVCRKD